VQAAARTRDSGGPATPTPRPAEMHGPAHTAVELAGRRGLIAQRMHASLRDMAQLTLGLEADVTAALALRQQLKALWPEEQQPTVTDLVLRAVILALGEHPALNATLEGTTLRTHGSIDLGLAVDAEGGLVVPVLHQAEALSLREQAQHTRDLATRARENCLRPEDVAGGSFTLTNLGGLGIDFFTPIINPPQVAILGLGRVFPRLSLAAGQVAERQYLTLSLTIDHRAIDGAPAARFLGTVKRNLELPAALLA
ncbi:MAG: dihydrolipoamide acetyltransferase family protein, partial [Chloroflexota bacterium]